MRLVPYRQRGKGFVGRIPCSEILAWLDAHAVSDAGIREEVFDAISILDAEQLSLMAASAEDAEQAES